MKSILISMLLRIVTRLTSKRLINELRDLVTIAQTHSADMNGTQKRAFVLDYVKTAAAEEYEQHKGRILNAALEVVVLWVREKLG